MVSFFQGLSWPEQVVVIVALVAPVSLLWHITKQLDRIIRLLGGPPLG